LVDVDYNLHYEALKKISAMRFVQDAVAVTGPNDMLIKAIVNDAEELGDFVLKKLKSIPGVRKTETLLVLETAK
tara:strand:- start:7448 stop:7669 length:222 start_codon:yes stop_codon:yes gene_type:complete